MAAQCKLIFEGELAPGKTQDEVQQKVAALYKVPVAKIVPWFSGTPVTIHTGLDEATAAKYQHALAQAGLICTIKSDTPPKTDEAKPARPPQAPVEQMTCPKCRERQPQSPTCVKCGVVIARYLEKQQTDELWGSGAPGKQTKLTMARGKPTSAPKDASGGTEDIHPEARAKKFQLLSVSAIVFVLLAMGLPMINISCHHYKLVTFSARELQTFTPRERSSPQAHLNIPRELRPPQPPARKENARLTELGPEVPGYLMWVWRVIIGVAVGVSVFGVLGMWRFLRVAPIIGVLLCLVGIGATLWLGYVFGIEGEKVLSEEFNVVMAEMQHPENLKKMAGGQPLDPQVQAVVTKMMAEISIKLEMDAGYYLMLAAFVAGMIGFFSPALCAETRTGEQIVLWIILGGIALVILGMGMYASINLSAPGDQLKTMLPQLLTR